MYESILKSHCVCLSVCLSVSLFVCSFAVKVDFCIELLLQTLSEYFCNIRKIYIDIIDKKNRLSSRRKFSQLGISDEIVEKIIAFKLIDLMFDSPGLFVTTYLQKFIAIKI